MNSPEEAKYQSIEWILDDTEGFHPPEIVDGKLVFKDVNQEAVCKSKGLTEEHIKRYILEKEIKTAPLGTSLITQDQLNLFLDNFKEDSSAKNILGVSLEELNQEENWLQRKSILMKNKTLVETNKKPSVEEFLNFEYNEKTGKLKQVKTNIDKVAEYIENKFDVRTIYGIKEETIEVYSEGIWTVKGRGVIKAEIERILGTYSTNNIVNEVLEKIKRRTETSRDEADKIPDWKRCVLNGVLDLENPEDFKFLPHSKDYNFKNKFPMKYNPLATCPKIQEFLKETFYEEDILKIQEWFGLHLIRRYAFKRAVILHGPKNTGKSVYLNLLTVFVGNNVSGLSLQEIGHGKPFDLLALKDKDANICDDLSSADMKATGGFKMIVGDGYINGEMKFGDKCRFRNSAKNTDACNNFPSIGQDIDDSAFYERVITIPVENVIPKEQMKKDLIDELTSPEELSGLLNWAIEGYKRLIKQNGFSNEKTAEETKYLMIQNGNSLAKFANEVLIQSDGNKIDKEEMYQVYCYWCRNHKPALSPDSKDKIGKTLTRFASYTQASSNGKERYWLNVKISPRYDSYYTSENNMSNYSKMSESAKNKVINENKIDTYIISKPVIAVSNKFTEKDLEQTGLSEKELDEILNQEVSHGN